MAMKVREMRKKSRIAPFSCKLTDFNHMACPFRRMEKGKPPYCICFDIPLETVDGESDWMAEHVVTARAIPCIKLLGQVTAEFNAG